MSDTPDDEAVVGASLAERILDAVPLLLYVFDVCEHRMSYVNRHVENVIGYTPEDYQQQGTGLTVRVLHPDDEPRLAAHMTRLASVEEGGYLDFEYRVRDRGGAWHWFRSRDSVLTRDEAGRVTRVLGVAEDITERQQLEEERERLISIIEATEDLVSIIRPDGSVCYANRAGCELVGVDPDAGVEGVNIADHHSPEVAARIFQELWPAAIRDGSARIELPLLHTSGREIPVSIIVAAHRGEGGEVEYLSCIMRDMRDEHRTAAEIRGREAELHQRIAEREAEQRAASRELEALPRALAGSLEDAIAGVRDAAERVRDEHGDALAGGELEGIAEALERLEAFADSLALPSERR